MVINKKPRIGIDEPGHQVYVLEIYDFLSVLSPPHGFNMKEIDPIQYFITSGDAIQKCNYMLSQYWKYAGEARKQLNSIKNPTKTQIQFEKQCWNEAGQLQKLLAQLKKVRQDNIFLETEWDEHLLHIKIKNPRTFKKQK